MYDDQPMNRSHIYLLELGYSKRQLDIAGWKDILKGTVLHFGNYLSISLNNVLFFNVKTNKGL